MYVESSVASQVFHRYKPFFVTLGFVDSVSPKVLGLHSIVLGEGGGGWCPLSLMCQTLLGVGPSDRCLIDAPLPGRSFLTAVDREVWLGEVTGFM